MANYTAKALQLPGGGEPKLIELKDAVAREATVGGTHYKGVTTTPLTDGAATNPIVIGGQSYTAVNGDMVIYNDGVSSDKEFLVSSVDNKWHEFQDLSDTEALAYVDSADGDITPEGTLSGFDVTLSSVTKYVSESADGGASYSAGSADNLTMSVSSESLVIGWTPSIPTEVTLPTFVEQTIVEAVSAVAQPSFSGTQAAVTVAPAT